MHANGHGRSGVSRHCKSMRDTENDMRVRTECTDYVTLRIIFSIAVNHFLKRPNVT